MNKQRTWTEVFFDNVGYHKFESEYKHMAYWLDPSYGLFRTDVFIGQDKDLCHDYYSHGYIACFNRRQWNEIYAMEHFAVNEYVKEKTDDKLSDVEYVEWELVRQALFVMSCDRKV